MASTTFDQELARVLANIRASGTGLEEWVDPILSLQTRTPEEQQEKDGILSTLGGLLHEPKRRVDIALNYYANEGLRRNVLGGGEPVPAGQLAKEAYIGPPELGQSPAEQHLRAAGRGIMERWIDVSTDPLLAAIPPAMKVLPHAARVVAGLGFTAAMAKDAIHQADTTYQSYKREGWSPSTSEEAAKTAFDVGMVGTMLPGLIPRRARSGEAGGPGAGPGSALVRQEPIVARPIPSRRYGRPPELPPPEMGLPGGEPPPGPPPTTPGRPRLREANIPESPERLADDALLGQLTEIRNAIQSSLAGGNLERAQELRGHFERLQDLYRSRRYAPEVRVGRAGELMQLRDMLRQELQGRPTLDRQLQIRESLSVLDSEIDLARAATVIDVPATEVPQPSPEPTPPIAAPPPASPVAGPPGPISSRMPRVTPGDRGPGVLQADPAATMQAGIAATRQPVQELVERAQASGAGLPPPAAGPLATVLEGGEAAGAAARLQGAALPTALHRAPLPGMPGGPALDISLAPGGPPRLAPRGVPGLAAAGAAATAAAPAPPAVPGVTEPAAAAFEAPPSPSLETLRAAGIDPKAVAWVTDSPYDMPENPPAEALAGAMGEVAGRARAAARLVAEAERAKPKSKKAKKLMEAARDDREVASAMLAEVSNQYEGGEALAEKIAIRSGLPTPRMRAAAQGLEAELAGRPKVAQEPPPAPAAAEAPAAVPAVVPAAAPEGALPTPQVAPAYSYGLPSFVGAPHVRPEATPAAPRVVVREAELTPTRGGIVVRPLPGPDETMPPTRFTVTPPPEEPPGPQVDLAEVAREAMGEPPAPTAEPAGDQVAALETERIALREARAQQLADENARLRDELEETRATEGPGVGPTPPEILPRAGEEAPGGGEVRGAPAEVGGPVGEGLPAVPGERPEPYPSRRGRARRRVPGARALPSSEPSVSTATPAGGTAIEELRANGETAVVEPLEAPAPAPAPPKPRAPAFAWPHGELERTEARSMRQKATDNVSALRLLKGIEAEDRFATPDEARALASFVGWGGMPRVFKEYDYGPEADYWQERHTEIKELLTPEEYEAAKASVTNAHFTREEVIREMWGRLADWGGDRRMRVLEPSMGVGNFVSARPSMFQAAQVTGVELDPITGRIAKRLFPSANIHVGGFEATPIPNNYFDVAISNVPFGPYGVSDPRFRDEPFLTKRIHNYFFAKALDKVRPGGVVAFITSHYTLDAKDPAFREYIAERAWLVGAARLPASTFQRNANTAVTTDIVFLQKKVEGQERPAWAAPDTWATVIPQEGYRDAYDRAVEPHLNSYFVDNPGQVLGELKIGDGTGGPDELTVGGNFDAAALRGALGRIGDPQLLVPPPAAAPLPPVATADELRRMKPGNLAVRDRGVWQLQPDGTYAEAGIPKTAVQAAAAWIPIRDAARDVIANQLERGTDAELARAQKALNKAYDGFVQKHGPIHSKAAQAMADDPDFPLTLALEDWKPPQYRKEGRKRTLVAAGKATKRDIFSKRTVAGYEPPSSAESTQQAYGISLAEQGSISTDRVASLLKTTPSDALRRLLDEGFAYEDPAHGGELFTAEEYLSGDVVDKLEHAQAATTLEPERFRRNVAALEAVQPTPLSPAEVTVQLGASWVPAEDYEEFAGVELGGGRPGNVRVKHSEGLGIFRVDWDHQLTYSAAATTTYGTAAMNALDLFEAGMNLRTPVVHKGSGDDRVVDDEATALARDKLDQIKEKFQSWIFSDPTRASRLMGTYNRQFNNQRLRTPDGSHLVFPGMNRSVLRGGDLEPHQKNDVWRILTQPNTLVAEPVGSGKTWTLVAALMEARRMGHVKKPVLAVPNAVFEQWGEEWRRLYPQAKLLIVQPDQLRGKARAETMSRIATEEWDGVLVSHEALKSLPLSVKAVEATVREEIALLDQTLRDLADDLGEGESIEDFAERATAKSGRRSRGVSRADTKLVKQIEKQKASLKARLKKLYEESKRDKTIAFDELGVDMLAVDESHYFNNLFFSTKLGMVAGIANTNAGRAFDLYLKVRDLQRRQGGRGVVFATATPVRNTLAEMYTLFRYLNPDFLKQRGLRHFDNWVRAFATARAALELKPTGSGYRAKTRFSAFVNVPELLTAFRNFSAVMTAEDLKLPVPEIAVNSKGQRAPNFVEIQPSKEMRAFVETLNDRAAALKGKGRAKKGEDNMLAVTTDGRKGAIDLTLVGRAAEPAAGQKLDQVRQKVLDVYKRTTGRRGVQAVFLDLSTPDAQPFSAYRWLRDRWVAAGIPAEEIAFAHSFDRKSRSELFGKLNRSEIRIVLGSSKKMGVGANFQTNLVALHNVDVPWTPDGYEQRIGRALRQGNENAEVEIHNYTTKATFDAYMWQTLATKAGFIGQVMTGKASARTMEDVSLTYLTAQEALAATSENPVVVKKIQLEADLRKFERLQGAHQLELFEIGRRRADWERQEVFHTDKARDILDAVRQVGEAKSLELFDQPGQDPMAPASKTFEKRTDEAGDALKAIIEGIAPGPGTYYVGRYRKFPIWVRRQQAKDAVFTDVRLPTPSRVAELGEQQIVVGTEWRPQYTGSGTGLLQSMEAQAPIESDAQGHAAAAVRKRNEIAKLAVPQFRHSGELERVKRELAEVNKELATEKDDVDAAKMEQDPVDDGGEAAEEADVEAGEDGEFEEEGLDEGEVPPVDPGAGGGAGGGRRPPRGPRPPGDDGDATPDGLPSDGPQPGEHGWDRRVREAKARTARRGRGGQANVGVDPMGMGDLAVVGADLVVKGLRRFGAWSREMLRLFGRMIPGLQGMLRGLWNWVRQMFGASGRGPTPGERQRAARRPGFEEYRTEFEEATAGQPGAGRRRYPWEEREIPPEEVRRAAEEAARPSGAEPQPAYGKPPKADVNFDRIGGAPDIKEWQARVVESLKPRWGKIRSYRSWAEARESAVRAGLTEQDFIQLVKERGAVTDIEIEAGRMMRQEGAESAFAKLNRLKELQEQRRQTTDDQAKRRLDEEIMEADREYRDALARYVSVTSATVEAASELGRALNIHRKMAEAITPEERFFRQLLRKHPGASEQLQAELADAVMRRDATKIREIARSLYKPGVLDYATEWFVNSLLSGLTTLEVNVLGNLSWEALFRTPERGLAAGLEAAGARQWVERIFGKDPLPRERFGREFEEALRTHYQTRFGALRSLKYAWEFLLNEPQAIGAAGEFRPPAFTGFLGKAIRTPSRMMYALDLGSRWAAMEAEAAVQSVRRAIQESRGSGGWTRDQVTSRMRELQDGYRRYAELDARRQAGEVLAKEDYQYLAKNPMYGRWQQSVKQAGAKATFTDNVDRFSGALLQMREAHPWLTFFAPFIKTPSRILAAALERSPWGAYDTFRKAKSGEIRGGELTDAMARVVYGNMIGASLYLLARQGLVTGSGPADPKERATLRKTGWEPYSVKIGDTYVSMARLEPFGTHLGWAADLAEAQNVRGAGELYDKLIQGISLNIVNKTYLQGAIGLAEAIGDPERYGAAFGRKTLGAFVPNILAQAARAIDPNVRETDTIEGTLLSRVPIASMSLPPQRAGTGEIITREEHPLSRWLNPFRYSVEKGPEANLERIFLDTGYTPQRAPKTVTIPGTGGRKVALTSAERQAYGSYKERATGFARTLAQNEQFLGLEPFQQEELLKRVYRFAHDAAHRAMVASVMQRAADIEWVK